MDGELESHVNIKIIGCKNMWGLWMQILDDAFWAAMPKAYAGDGQSFYHDWAEHGSAYKKGEREKNKIEDQP